MSIIIGIDHGYYAIKTAHCSFPAGLTSYGEHEPYTCQPEMYPMRNHDIWIYVRCANSDPRIAFDRLYDLIDEAAGHGFLVRGTSFDHCSGNTLKDRI